MAWSPTQKENKTFEGGGEHDLELFIPVATAEVVTVDAGWMMIIYSVHET